MKEFTLKVGNTGVPLIATLLDADDAAIDLTGATVTLSMALPNSTTKKINASACTVLNQSTDKGGVQYNFTSGNVDTAGDYDAEFKVTFAGGAVVLYPTDVGQKSYIRIHIQESI
jgi:hypothetical protein